MFKRKYASLHFLALMAAVLFFPDTALAQSAQPEVLTASFRDQGNTWATNMQSALGRLFIILATLDFCWMAIQLSLSVAPLEKWTAQIVNKILFYGIGLFLLYNGFDIAEAVVNSFVKLAGMAAGANENNSIGGNDMWKTTLETAKELFKKAGDCGVTEIGLALIYVLSAVAMVALGGYITALMILAFAEAYVAMGAGTVVLGFLGSTWSSDYGRKFINFLLLTGVKLFATLIIAHLGMALIGGWINDIRHGDLYAIARGLTSLVVFVLLIQKIPATIAGIIAGGGIQGSDMMVGDAVKAAAVAAAAAASGGASAVVQATKLSNMEGTGVGGVVKNLAGAFSDDIKGAFEAKDMHMENQPSQGHRMASRLQEKQRELQHQQDAASTPNSIGAAESSSARMVANNDETSSADPAPAAATPDFTSGGIEKITPAEMEAYDPESKDQA